MATFFAKLGNVFGLLITLTLVCSTVRVSSAPGFIETRRTHFLKDGSPFLFNGFNSYWMMHVAADPTQRDKVSNVFREAAAAGLTVCRTWAFTDGGDKALQISPGVYDQRVFQVIFVSYFFKYHVDIYSLRLKKNVIF